MHRAVRPSSEKNRKQCLNAPVFFGGGGNFLVSLQDCGHSLGSLRSQLLNRKRLS